MGGRASGGRNLVDFRENLVHGGVDGSPSRRRCRPAARRVGFDADEHQPPRQSSKRPGQLERTGQPQGMGGMARDLCGPDRDCRIETVQCSRWRTGEHRIHQHDAGLGPPEIEKPQLVTFPGDGVDFGMALPQARDDGGTEGVIATEGIPQSDDTCPGNTYPGRLPIRARHLGSLLHDLQTQEVGCTRNARVEVADALLAQTGELILGKIRMGLHLGPEVLLHQALVL